MDIKVNFNMDLERKSESGFIRKLNIHQLLDAMAFFREELQLETQSSVEQACSLSDEIRELEQEYHDVLSSISVIEAIADSSGDDFFGGDGGDLDAAAGLSNTIVSCVFKDAMTVILTLPPKREYEAGLEKKKSAATAAAAAAVGTIATPAAAAPPLLVKHGDAAAAVPSHSPTATTPPLPPNRKSSFISAPTSFSSAFIPPTTAANLHEVHVQGVIGIEVLHCRTAAAAAILERVRSELACEAASFVPLTHIFPFLMLKE